MPLPAALPDGLIIEPEGSGISEPLSRQVNLLGAILGRAIRARYGKDTLALVEHLRLSCKRGDLDDAARVIAQTDDDDLLAVLRAFTTFFHLVNKAEQLEIVRINRKRAHVATAEKPRSESIADAIHRLSRGRSLDDVIGSIGQLDIQPTFTAHPTEARRRTILLHQQRIAALLEDWREREQTPEEEEALVRGIQEGIQLLLATDEVRPVEVTVEDEIRQGLYFLATAVWQTVPRIHADVRRALRIYYGDALEGGNGAIRLPAFLSYRSWIGGDRDGNPNVTPEMTAWTLRQHRRDALLLHRRALDELRLTLSVSDQQATTPQALYDSIEEDRQSVELDPRRLRQNAHEPIRLKLMLMQAKIDVALTEEAGGGYDARTFRDDLELVAQALRAAGLGSVADDGALADLIVQAEAFGFHLAALDIRQHSRVHEAAVAELLREGGIETDYAKLGEAARLAVLSELLEAPSPIPIAPEAAGDALRSVLDTLAVVRNAVDTEPDSIGGYIISMTDAVSDVLEVLLLARQAGLGQTNADGTVSSALDVAPLLETISDLKRSGEFLKALFEHPVYARHLDARGRFQEVMLGYSDSNKDGGYWMANHALHRGQRLVARTCAQFGVTLRLFHGRGGTVGRGGGRANQAIRALPQEVQNGRIRFTEQGEVISFRYAHAGIARRHLEQIVHAQLGALTEETDHVADDELGHRLMQRLAETSMRAYRALIESEDFWPWYLTATPIEHIAGIPMASRPVSRGTAADLDFDSLRAIPWVFGWTQTRYTVPGWYGIGSAFEDWTGSWEALRELYPRWPFLRAVTDNALREMARARFVIARRYAEQAGGNIHDRLCDEFEKAERALLDLSGQSAPMERSPVIGKSIALRNPYTDVLNLIQLELMRRFRGASADAEARERLRHALFVSINGVAAAMQSTG